MEDNLICTPSGLSVEILGKLKIIKENLKDTFGRTPAGLSSGLGIIPDEQHANQVNPQK